MPVEGQWRRTGTALTRRDKLALAAFLGVATLAVAVSSVVYLTRAAHPSRAGCVAVTIASTMGGAQTRRCGSAAHSFCRTEGRADATVAAACRKQGYSADLRRG